MMYDFELSLLPDPQSALRVLGLFAQRQLVPQSVHCERRGNSLCMALAVADMDAAAAQILTEKLQQLVVVVQCQLRSRDDALAA